MVAFFSEHGVHAEPRADPCMQSDGDEGVLVDLAIKAIEMLAAVKPGADRAAMDGDSGAGLSCGELPMAQATILCILRVGIIERLSETGQVHC